MSRPGVNASSAPISATHVAADVPIEAPCGANVDCAGTGCAGSTCTYGTGGLGFFLSGFSLAADDGTAGGPDEITITVTVDAGLTPGTCTNAATAFGGPLEVGDSDTVTIEPVSADCDLMHGDVTFPPTSPARGMAESESEAFILEFLNSREGLELNRAFVKIADPKVRKSVVDLVRALSASGSSS